MERTLRLDLEYEGTRYFGFSVQPGLPTIQEAIERALARVLGEAVRVTPAGRTDTGVHARGQVASFRTGSQRPPATIERALNALLPDDIVVGSCREVASGF